ncbi:hypothetical protein [Sphingomonas sp. DT-204]|uniref:hypothetical protein n=1 Tax=Sphingomonas sp. DT-204 TaxID=3396166 RepID=UPI003F1D4A88
MTDSLAPSDDDQIAFTPVPTTSHRRDGWTADRQRRFIANLAEHGGVAAAARAVGMTPQSANRLRKRPGAASFARAWDMAFEQGRQNAFEEAVRRGRDGWISPVMRNGRVVGHRHRFDNRLLYAACYGEPMTRFTRRDRGQGDD